MEDNNERNPMHNNNKVIDDIDLTLRLGLPSNEIRINVDNQAPNEEVLISLYMHIFHIT